jgi:hypothetical protein
LFGVADDVVQVLLESALVVDQRFGITNNIDEQDVTYLELNFRFGRHLSFLLSTKAIPQPRETRSNDYQLLLTRATINRLSLHGPARRRKGEAPW